MRKSIFILAPVALVLLASSGSALAVGKNATLTVSANISKTTCDVILTRETVDFGNFVKADFKGKATKTPIKSESVAVSLTNCADAADAGTASLIIAGDTLAAHADMFSMAPADDVGIMIADQAAPATYIKKNEKVKLGDFADAADATAAELQKLTKSFTVGIAKTVADSAEPTTIGSIRAPITFQFDYN